MKSEKPKRPRQELEASLTALLLGELPPDKAAALREFMAKDAELARLYERLEQTIGLVRETAAPAEQGAQSAPKLSNRRREQLLAHFKTVAPKEFRKPTSRTIRARELAIAAGIVAFIGVAAWLTFNLTQESLSSTSRVKAELGQPSQMVASYSRSSTPPPAADTSLAPAQSPTIHTASADSGGFRGIGSQWQTSFDASSAGKPKANQLVLPALRGADIQENDFSLPTEPRKSYGPELAREIAFANQSVQSPLAKPAERPLTLSVSTNSVPIAGTVGDPQWLGTLERGNYSPSAHSSTNQFVSRSASVVLPTNLTELGDIANLAYEYHVPALVTNLTATNAPSVAYYSDLNRNGQFDPQGTFYDSTKSDSRSTGGFGRTGTGINYAKPSQITGALEQLDEMSRRQSGGLASADSKQQKNGDAASADDSGQQFRRKLQGIINNAANTPVEQVPVIDPATGLPVAGAYGSGAIDPATGLPIPLEVAEAQEKMAASVPLATLAFQVESNAFLAAIEPHKSTASQLPITSGGTGGGGGRGDDRRVTVSGQMPARTMREPALAPAQATSPSTPITGEKLAEVAQEGKDTSGSNIYLGKELAKADVKFGTWGLDADGLPHETKKEEEQLKQGGEVRDGVTIAGRGFRLMGPKEEPPPPSGVPVASQTVQLLGDLPVLGKAFKNAETKPGLNDNLSDSESLSISSTNLQTWAGLLSGVIETNVSGYAHPEKEWQFTTGTANLGWSGAGETNEFLSTEASNVIGANFYLRGQGTQANWVRNFDDGRAVLAQNSRNSNAVVFSGGSGTQSAWNPYSIGVVGYYNVPVSNGLSQGASKVDPLNVVGYYDTSKLTESDRRAITQQLSQAAIKNLAARMADQDAKVREAQADVERLRQNYQIADALAVADAPTMLMSAEEFRKLEGMRIELEAQVMREETQLDALKKLPREKLVASLPTAAPDMALNSLVEQKSLSEQALILKQRELGEASPEVARLRDQVSDLNSKIDRQTDGILSGLDGRVTAVKEQLVKLRNEVEKAKTNDMAVAKKTDSYWEAQRELDGLQRFSSVLAMKIASENIEASLPKSTMVEIMDDAVPAAARKTDIWDRIRGKGKFESQARIKVDRGQSDVSFSTEPRLAMQYDPYFIQNEFETIRSDRILGKVVAELNLQKEWAKAGQALSTNQAIALLKEKLELKPVRNSGFVEIGAKSDKPEEAAKLANAVAKSYQGYRQQIRKQLSLGGMKALEEQWKEQEAKVREAEKELDRLRAAQGIEKAPTAGIRPAASQQSTNRQVDAAPPKPAVPPPVPQPEIQTRENAFSTFSLNVSDVAFKLAAASLEKQQMPEPASIRSEEFINAFDYRDPEAATGVPVAFAWERARYPYAQNRDLLRFSIKTAAQGRQAGRPLNLVLLLDNSGSMERADRVAIIREALKVLASQLQPQDRLSVITFARTAQLRVDGVPGNQAAQVAEDISGLTPDGGTNIEEAMNLAYQTALRHYLANGINRVVLLTDGAANLGNVEPDSLKQKVEANRKQGVALDCFGIGWEGLNDDLLETLSRNGDGRYGFINSPEEAATEFAGQLAGALNVAASDVKVQVEFNPARVTAYRQIGYAKHQLTKEQFRDNTVDAAEIAAQEAGNALYVIEVNPAGQGPLGTVRARFKIPGTSDYREHEWTVPFNGNAIALEQASPAMRLAATASAFSEWLATSPYATEVTPDTLLSYLSGVPEVYGADARPKKLEWMIRQAKSIAGGEIRNSNVETRNNGEIRKAQSEEKRQIP